MAKQNSAPDPVSAAMSAIESALNLTDDDNFVDSPSSPAPNAAAKPVIVTPVLKPAAPPAESAPLLRPSSAPLASLNESDAKPPLSATPPANDDRETVGAILQAMNARPGQPHPIHSRPDRIGSVGCALRPLRLPEFVADGFVGIAA